MAILSVYIPDSGANRVFDAIASHYNYQDTVPNPRDGENLIIWSDSVAHNTGLLPIASGQGYVGSGLPHPTIYPFVDGANGILGVITGVAPTHIPNPENKASFTNGVIRGFLTEHTRVYELDLLRKQAEAAAAGSENIAVNDGSTAMVYNYHMICLQPAKPQYDALASVIAPGNTFNIALSANGANPITHYGLQAGITDTARQQLLVLELAGGTTTGGIQTLFYVRCDPQTHIAQVTNIPNFDIIGKQCSFSGLLSHLGLKEIG